MDFHIADPMDRPYTKTGIGEIRTCIRIQNAGIKQINKLALRCPKIGFVKVLKAPEMV